MQVSYTPLTKAELDAECKAALDLANKIRAAVGLPRAKRLLKGLRMKGHSCPIARTARGHGECHVLIARDMWVVYINERPIKRGVIQDGTTKQFVADFDNGFIPHLIKKA